MRGARCHGEPMDFFMPEVLITSNRRATGGCSFTAYVVKDGAQHPGVVVVVVGNMLRWQVDVGYHPRPDDIMSVISLATSKKACTLRHGSFSGSIVSMRSCHRAT